MESRKKMNLVEVPSKVIQENKSGLVLPYPRVICSYCLGGIYSFKFTSLLFSKVNLNNLYK